MSDLDVVIHHPIACRLQALAARAKRSVFEELKMAVATWIILRERNVTHFWAQDGETIVKYDLGAVDR